MHVTIESVSRFVGALIAIATLTSCATVDKGAADTVVLLGVVEKVYDPCSQSFFLPNSIPIDKPPGVALVEAALKPLLRETEKAVDKAFASRECLYLIRPLDFRQIHYRTSKEFAVGSCVKVYLLPERMRSMKGMNPLMTIALVDYNSAIEPIDCQAVK